jgi:hypothetical protein
VQWVEQALQSRERHQPHPVKDGWRKLSADWLNCFSEYLATNSYRM